VLPLVIAGILWGRHALARRAATTGTAAAGPPGAGPAALAASVLVAAVVVFALFAFVAFTGSTHGAPLDAPADPLSDYPARPEWFLMPMFALRKLFHGSMEFYGTSLVPGAAAGFLALLPWLDRSPDPRRGRVLVLAPAVGIFAGAISLALHAMQHDAGDPAYRKAHAKAEAQAVAASELAMAGVPPGGALEMVRRDPEMRGKDLFDRHCASCHVLGDLGDPEKATATKLDGWGTPAWIEAMIHEPDAPRFFGKGPFNGQMPSVDTRPAGAAGEGWHAMVKTDAEKHAVALFLASQGDEPGDPPRAMDDAVRALGEKILSERCTTCHLYKTNGDDEGSGAAPELGGYGSVAWTRAQVANPATAATYRDKALDEALKKHMPRFDGDLSASDVDLVARWTRSHARGL
jgi:ubiquinol-cytochrome c reductase cytochrome b subunit